MIKRLIFDVDSTLIVGVNFLPFIEKTLKRLTCSHKRISKVSLR